MSEIIKPLLFVDIRKGMPVIDNDGDVGIVTDCEDPHNVVVEYDNDGRGIHCLAVDCEAFSKSFLCVYEKRDFK